MRSWSPPQRALVAGLVSTVAVLTLVTIAVWPDDDEPVATGGATTTTVDGRTTTTTRRPTSTTGETTTTAETSTTAEEPTTTAAPATTARPTTTAASAPAPPPPTTASAPAYRSSIEGVTAAQLGSSYTPGIGCAEPSALRAVDMTHWDYEGNVREGRLIVHSSEAQNVAAIFGDLYAARFPIQQIVPVDRYDADDQASMRANNTSGYNCRYVAGDTTLSNHAHGRAIDVNPLHNPYVKDGSVDPPEGAPWADRSNERPGMIYGGDVVVRAFSARGWAWGGYWSSGQDYQHFDKA